MPKAHQAEPEKLFLDRAVFMEYVENGTVMQFEKGKGYCIDGINDYDRAEEVLAQGGKVILTVKGKPVTQIIETDEAYEEVELSEGERHAIQKTIQSDH